VRAYAKKIAELERMSGQKEKGELTLAKRLALVEKYREEIRAVKEKIKVKISPEFGARYPEEHLASVPVLTEGEDLDIIKPKGVPT